MGNKKAGFIIGFLLLAFFGAFLSCAMDKAPLQIENSLPQNELAYYNDSFEKMREDLWDKSGYLAKKEQMQNFRLADMRFENGKLIIRTKTGSFSKGGLGSNYALRGNFDIQLDCRMDFLKGISGRDMDQWFSFGVFDKNQKMEKITTAGISLSMRGGGDRGYLRSYCLVNGRWREGSSQKIETFNGSFRFLRTGKTISTLYKKAETPEWTKMYTFRVTNNDMLIGFMLRNFFGNRTTIRATHSISVELDNLKINAAQEIIEEEI